MTFNPSTRRRFSTPCSSVTDYDDDDDTERRLYLLQFSTPIAGSVRVPVRKDSTDAASSTRGERTHCAWQAAAGACVTSRVQKLER